MPANILNLPDFRVQRVEEAGHDYHFYAEVSNPTHMWTLYRDAVTAVLPDARIVIDKCHVVRMANDAVEKLRKSLREQLIPKQRRGLMHDRFVLLKRERDLNDKEALLLNGWTKNYPELGASNPNTFFLAPGACP